jgi:3-deoxy-7-phosphoheptulonate synthase
MLMPTPTLKWSSASWREREARQQPTYPDADHLDRTLARLQRLPPLVAQEEVEHLRDFLAQAAAGRRFMLQGGDCAERFEDCTADAIGDKLRVLLQMSVVLTFGGGIPVFHVGRIAGQYAKPRSQDMECLEGVDVPTYRGDLINSTEATLEARTPDPARMLEGYLHSGVTLNHLRALVEGGFADLHHLDRWDLHSSAQDVEAYRRTMQQVKASLRFLDTLGTTPKPVRTGEIFTSHEALLLPYEEALTRDVEGQPYNLGAHMVWLGERTRDLSGAHVEYLRGIRNPIGIKLGPKVQVQELLALLARLDPRREPGRITLITRLGAGKAPWLLPALVEAVRESGHPVLWCCDPMHGNGLVTRHGVKTRNFDHILAELRETFEVHRSLDSILGGVHFELTGEHVTECLGGGEALSEEDLGSAYETGCDPRLNRNQSLEMAFLITGMLRGEQDLNPLQVG